MANEQPTKKCPRCGETKPIDGGYTFTWRKRAFDRIRIPHAYCRKCRVAYNAASANKDLPKKRAHFRRMKLRRNYGITPEQHAAQIEAQGWACAICQKSLRGLSPQTVHVDHCHKTGALRGILCGPCNTAIGALRESPEIMLAAIAYLRACGKWSRSRVADQSFGKPELVAA